LISESFTQLDRASKANDPSEEEQVHMTDRIYYSKEAEKIARQRESFLLLSALLLGLGVGAVLTLFLAPRKGKETRRLVAETLETGYQKGIGAARDALNRLAEEYPNVRGKVEEMLQELTP
jgi:hypothetical protein